jgi:2-desacetyl-2-hydroxyethyl bacteriochlorophyllide A dehydrogenase
MRAVVLTDVRRIELLDIEEPTAARNDVTIEVRAGGICGSDMHAYRGHHPFRKPPVVMGHEVAGRVIAIGSDVTRVAIGERVAVEPQIACGTCASCLRGLANLCRHARRPGLGWGGTFAERMTAPEHVVYRLDPDTSYEEGALVEPTAVALRAVRHGGLQVGDRVAVLGVGPIGGLVARLCQVAGAGSLMVTDVKGFNLDLMRTLGVADAIDASAVDVSEAAHEITHGAGFDIAFVTSPARTSVNDAMKILRPGGRVVQIAIHGESVPFDATAAVLAEIEVRASLTYTSVDFEIATTLINRGVLDVRPFITHRYGLDDAPAAFRAIEDGLDHVKVVLQVGTGETEPDQP